MKYTQTIIKWYQVERDLVATLCELRTLYARVQFAETGALPDGIVRDDLDKDVKLERGNISERELFFDGLLGVYQGLNYVWATRRLCMSVAENVGGISFQVSTPTEGAFAALVPAVVQKRVGALKIGDRPICLMPVRLALQAALEKLTHLCYRISLMPGVQSPEKIEQPEGFDDSLGSQSFDEEDLELHLAMVYARLNEAWNSRFDKAPVTSPEEVRSRRKFPREVLS